MQSELKLRPRRHLILVIDRAQTNTFSCTQAQSKGGAYEPKRFGRDWCSSGRAPNGVVTYSCVPKAKSKGTPACCLVAGRKWFIFDEEEENKIDTTIREKL